MKKMFLAEMAYPSGFSFDELNKLTSFAARQRYCRQHLKRIGSGSSRVVFLVDDEKVLKLAKNPKGIAQNEREAGFHDSDIGLFAKTFEVADDSTWIEMEAAKKVTQKEFKRVCGITYKLFCLLWAQIAIDFGVTGLNRWYWESPEA